MSRVTLAARPLPRTEQAEESRRFLEGQLRSVLQGTPVEPNDPPALELQCDYVYQVSLYTLPPK